MAEKGMDCVLSIGGATVAIIRDFDPDYTAPKIDVTTRDSAGWEEVEQGLKSWKASGEMLWVPTNTGLQALWSAYAAGSKVTAAWTDSAGHGRTGDAIVTQFKPGPQGLADGLMCSFALESDGAASVVEPGS